VKDDDEDDDVDEENDDKDEEDDDEDEEDVRAGVQEDGVDARLDGKAAGVRRGDRNDEPNTRCDRDWSRQERSND
jgi:hypothetical protein